VITANLPEPDRRLLAQLLDELRGGAAKVLITSRSPENWLRPDQRVLLELGGLDREERWEYCNAILRDLNQGIDREDEALVKLMDLLGGHPLAMRAILPRLEKMSAGHVLSALQSNMASLKQGGDPEQARLFATLAFVEQSLPPELQPLLTLLGMHEGFVTAALLEPMAQQVDAAWTRARINALMQAMITAGLLRDVGSETYQMHPLLTSYLRHTQNNEPADNRDSWTHAFVDVMGSVADELAPLELHQQRMPFHLHGQNFYYALAEAERLKMSDHIPALTQSLAFFALNTRNFAAASRLFERLAAHSVSRGNLKGEAAAYHQLGMIAQEQRDFAAAEQYRKSLAIKEKQGYEHVAALTYGQFGRLAVEQRDFAAAEEWYRKSLAITEKQGNEHVTAITYHQLGMIAEEQRDFAAAEQRYRKSLAIEEKQGNEHGAAITYHQLGMIAQEQRDFVVAQEWYRKSLAIEEKQGDEHGAAQTYHQLGMIAEEQRDFAAAEQLYRKALAIKEKQGNEHGAAITYGQLGILASRQDNFIEGGAWLLKALLAFIHTRDQHAAKRAVRIFLASYHQARPQDQEKLKEMWQEAGMGDLPG
jgi:tetratricopeptide (TPR) repeat protein